MESKPIENFKDRLKYIIERTGLTKVEFASRCQISRTQIFRYLKGEQSPGKKFLDNLNKQFPKVDMMWLITGIISLSDTETWFTPFRDGDLSFYDWISTLPFDSQLAEMLVFKAMDETGVVLEDKDRMVFVDFVKKKITHNILTEVVEQLSLVKQMIKKNK